MIPKVIVLKTDGTNCDEETAFAFNLAGGMSEIVHVNELRQKHKKLIRYQILAIPGGFSYGDDIVSGKILALELTSFFAQEIQSFIQNPRNLVIGICNGFQVLIRTGLLPFGHVKTMEATLTNNDSGRFECRWINLRIEKDARCVFLKKDSIISYQVAHGEGKLFASKEVMDRIEKQKLVAFRYVDTKGKPTQKYPQNPNGSLNAIAGITDPTGRIVGLMPHPERFVRRDQHPNWRRLKVDTPQGLPIFKSMISYVKTA